MPNQPLLIKNGIIVTLNDKSDILRGDILIKDSKISQISQSIKTDQFKIFDASDYLVLPGFIQTHVHLCQTLFRNRADDLNLLDWLQKKVWPFEGAHTEESLRLSAQLGIAELLLGGTSTIMDMGTVHHMNVVFEEIERSGIRAFCGKTMMDKGEIPETLKQSTSECLNDSLHLLKKWHNRANGRIKYAFAPRFVISCSVDLLKETARLCQEHQVLYHSHAAENIEETLLVKKEFGLKNLHVFEKLGLTAPNLCLAHCIWLDDQEKEILKQHQIKVLHCPSANLKLGSGIAPIPEYLEQGICVSLGSDGAPCNNNLDIFTEMRLAALIQKPKYGPRAMNSEVVLRMATIEGARTLGLGEHIGSIEVNKKADLVFCKINEVRSIPFENIYSKVVYSTNQSAVDHLMVDGDWVVRNKALVHYDVEEIINSANNFFINN